MIGRVAALGALIVAVVAVAVILLSRGTSYQVRAIFQNASQIVSGDEVQVAGAQIGSVSKIALTPEGQAELTLTINSSLYQPLRQGTHAIVRDPGLSSIAARYVQLDLGPATAPKIANNGVIPAYDTTSEVDLDQLFNTLNPATRKGLQNVIQGSALEYQGKGQMANVAWEYLNPAIASSSVLFAELNRDTAKFTRFIVTSSNLVTDLASRQSNLSGLVSHLSTTFSALARQQVALGQSVQRLPPFMRLTNTTFVNLRNTLGVHTQGPDTLTALINATKPDVNPLPGYPNGRLQALLQQLRPTAIDAVPTVRDLSNIISRPSPYGTCTVSNPNACNDLIELNELATPLAQATCGNQPAGQPLSCNSTLFVDGANRLGAFPISSQALQQSTPELAVGRPYAVDLTGWFEGYSHPGLYDANGAISRIAPVVGVTSTSNGALNLFPNLLTDLTQRLPFAQSVLTTGQGDRCPGSMERGPSPGTSSTTVESGFPCTTSQVPTGQ